MVGLAAFLLPLLLQAPTAPPGRMGLPEPFSSLCCSQDSPGGGRVRHEPSITQLSLRPVGLSPALPSPGPRRPPFNLIVSSSDTFQRSPGPCVVPANSPVFVEASLAQPSSRWGLFLHRCFLSPSSDPTQGSPLLLLLRGGCPAEASVSFHPPPPGSLPQTRLSFRLRPIFNASVQFLHCQLGLCRRRGAPRRGPRSADQPPGCLSQDEACTGSGSREEVAGESPRVHMLSQPIIVTVPHPPHRPPRFSPDQSQTSLGQVLPSAPQGTGCGGLDPAPVVAIAVSAFILGAVLTASLGLIYVQTAPPPPRAAPGGSPSPSQPRRSQEE
ncbi:transforming growth factor-beta receptor type 3-like protein isoform X1 [Sarcophilus harrisii]|uniref:transforming growth factor-beta receptor type 3-like protein isoform X1 n=1 Tax=Sarcophilus harrisii TaxID=9305 RepID=UPI001301D452|nr:transforming growth factor-beta receptor type 3-like protein isoform X1 [Sarcophilus harrisii]XP_031804182.1 transforming growth factor-beta receptor type 3-like protein isoform X1 [Sarcophilus harrisii]